MIKTICTVSFTIKKIRKIDTEINSTFDKYLERNPEEKLSQVERDHLLSLTKDQLTTFIQSLSHGEKLTMEHKKVPITVLTDEKLKVNDLINPKIDSSPDYFYSDDQGWHITKEKEKNYYSKPMFDKIITEEIYQHSSTAAYYSIDSYVSCRNGLGFEFN